MESTSINQYKLKIISADKKEFEIGEELKFCEVLKNLMNFQKNIIDDVIESEYDSEIIQAFISILRYYVNINEEIWFNSENIPNIQIPEYINKIIDIKNDSLYCLSISYKLLCLSDRWRCNIIKIISMITISNIINRDIDNITNEQIKQIFELDN